MCSSLPVLPCQTIEIKQTRGCPDKPVCSLAAAMTSILIAVFTPPSLTMRCLYGPNMRTQSNTGAEQWPCVNTVEAWPDRQRSLAEQLSHAIRGSAQSCLC